MFAMRKLIRPTREELERLKREYQRKNVVEKHRTPPVKTDKEVIYLKNNIDRKAHLVVKLVSGEEVSGWIEYYDKSFIRLTVEDGPNRFIFKKDILYILENRKT